MRPTIFAIAILTLAAAALAETYAHQTPPSFTRGEALTLALPRHSEDAHSGAALNQELRLTLAPAQRDLGDTPDALPSYENQDLLDTPEIRRQAEELLRRR
ncbi:MAG: hypothetical protein MRY63_09665 [Neomegalonema sp.]|nr:hypothetical protein [Neomegalonema sp.]